jgi:tetratricopeptide (TPR) repeat protein
MTGSDGQRALGLYRGFFEWDLKGAVEAWERSVELDPSRMGRHEEALDVLSRAAELSGRASSYLSYLGWAQTRAGRHEDACATLDELTKRAEEEYVAPLHRAVIVAALGELDRAFELLDQAVEKRNCWIVVPRLPLFDAFRYDKDGAEDHAGDGEPNAGGKSAYVDEKRPLAPLDRLLLTSASRRRRLPSATFRKQARSDALDAYFLQGALRPNSSSP